MLRHLRNVIPEPDYKIEQSCLFDKFSKLEFIPSVDGDKQVATLSFWLKNCGVSDSGATDNTRILSAGDTSTNFIYYQIMNTGATLNVNTYRAGPGNGFWNHAPTYRDYSAWQHFVISYDKGIVTTYVNGIVEPSIFNTTGTGWLNVDTAFNTNNVMMTIGSALALDTIATVKDFYLAEMHWIDGQALGCEHFALENAVGHYNPIPYEGDYGTNGFYLPFKAGEIGTDQSENSNDFTTTGITPDSIVADSPTNNHSTFIPYNYMGSTNWALSNGNRTVWQGSAQNEAGQGTYIETIGFNSGCWHRRFYMDAASNVSYGYSGCGLISSDWSQRGQDAGIFLLGETGTVKFWDGLSPSVTVGSTLQYTTGDYIDFDVDVDAQIVHISKNGVLGYSTTPSQWKHPFGLLRFAFEPYSEGSDYQVTIGDDGATEKYLPVCTDNLPEVTVNPKDNFKAVTYTGNSIDGDQSIITGFAPDFTWLKVRDYNDNHVLVDTLRGGDFALWSNSSSAETDNTATGDAVIFNPDGFTVKQTSLGNNRQNYKFVSWNFKAGGPAVANNDGSLPSMVSANQDMGFSIVEFATAAASGNATIGHGLGKIPSIIIVKNRVNASSEWDLHYEQSTGLGRLKLNSSDAYDFLTNPFCQISPGSSVFTYDQGLYPGAGDEYIAYCFTNTDMVQSGVYAGNGSTDGPFVTLPFKPAYIFIKLTDLAASNWAVYDNARDLGNTLAAELYLDTISTEFPNPDIDFLSNGFKLRWNRSINNMSAGNYLYLAIAEETFKHARGR